MNKDVEDVDFRLHKKEILRRAEDFTALFTKGSRWKGSALRFFYLPSDCRQVGFSVSKKRIKKAVTRNRVKRWMREAYRRNKQGMEGLQLIVQANREPTGYSEVEKEFISFCREIGNKR